MSIKLTRRLPLLFRKGIEVKEGFFCSCSVQKALVFFTQRASIASFSWQWNIKMKLKIKVYLKVTFGREINLKGLPYKVFMYDIWERDKFEEFTIYITRLFVFFRITLRHFEGNKNEIIEVYNKTTIVA